MQTRMLAALAVACAIGSGALAETVVVDDQVQLRQPTITVPKRGSTMDEVEKQFGAPLERHATVGGTGPAQPPITRWDYKDFAVVFERQWVIDSVVLANLGPPPAAQPAASAPASAPSGAAAEGTATPSESAAPPAGSAAGTTESAPAPAGSAAPPAETPAAPTEAPAPVEAPPPAAPGTPAAPANPPASQG